MNSFDIAVFLGLAIAMGTGFSTGLIRSTITIVAYIVAMPITIWVMSFVPPLTENANSPLMQNAVFFLGAFMVVGSVIGLGLAPVMATGIASLLGGEAYLRYGLTITTVATSLIAAFGFLRAMRRG